MKRFHRFTLVEILAVMALIAILSSLGFGVYSYAKGKAQESATEALMKQIEAGLGSFYAKHHYYPSSGGVFHEIKFTFGNADGTLSEIDFGDASTKLTYIASASSKADRAKNELFESFAKAVDIETIKNNLGNVTRDTNGKITSGELVDTWGAKIYYRSPGTFKPGSYDLLSAGPDGVFGSDNAADPTAITDLKKFRNDAGEKVCDDVFNF